jgi:hypothetical protein
MHESWIYLASWLDASAVDGLVQRRKISVEVGGKLGMRIVIEHS